MNRSTVACAAALAATLSGCGSAPRRDLPNPSAIPTLSLDEFPGLARMRPGLDPRDPAGAWDSDDEVVFALRLKKGDEVHRWILRLSNIVAEGAATHLDRSTVGSTVAYEEGQWTWSQTHGGERQERSVTSLLLPVGASVHDENGRGLSASVVKLPVRLLSRGLLPAIEWAKRSLPQGAPEPATGDEVDMRPFVDATIAMMALLNVVQEDQALAAYFWQVVEKPSVWSVIGNMGVHATLSIRFEDSVVPRTMPEWLPGAERVFVVPLDIDVNGSPALLVDVVTIDAGRPFSLCGGMVAATARHPSRPDVTFELQLVGAHCGRTERR